MPTVDRVSPGSRQGMPNWDLLATVRYLSEGWTSRGHQRDSFGHRLGRRLAMTGDFLVATECVTEAPWAPTTEVHRSRLRQALHLLAGAAAGRTRDNAPDERGALSEESRRRPTLPGGYPPSTIGAGGLNCRVRNGNGCLSAAMATGNCALSGARGPSTRRVDVRARGDRSVTPERSIASTSKFPSPRPISTGQLNALPHVHFRPINVVVWPRALPAVSYTHLTL